MEYAAGGNLRNQIEDGMGYGQVANLAKQTLSALTFTHGRNIMHRDLKPENILCAGQNRYILADFGLSKDDVVSASQQGTYSYMAPEVDGSSPYDCKVDIWSLGVILSECVKALPEGEPDPNKIREWCRTVVQHFKNFYHECDMEPQMSESIFFCLIYLVKDYMLVMKPEERLSAEEIKREVEPDLWDEIFQEEKFDPSSEPTTRNQMLQDEAFERSPLESSKDHQTSGSTSPINLEVTKRASPVGPGMLYDPARVDPWLSFVSDQYKA